jgi:predicted Zn-dependent protease
MTNGISVVRRAGVAGAVALAIAGGSLLAPASSPVQAREAISRNDKAQGQQAYSQIVQQFGGKVEGPLADYVRRVGLRVALVSIPGSTPQDWTITVLNSPVPNAMATPGGYLYITRGLLAMINSEAELASVLGHEAGHISGDHSDKRNSRATIGALGTIAATILGGNMAGQLANTVAGAAVSGYSRSQEHDADSRGMRYSAAAGYDPRAAASMLEALERVAAVEGRERMERGGLNSIFATHPVTRERVERVSREAGRFPPGGATNREAYLAAIDGMAFGDSVDQGIVTGPSFRHAGLGLGFDAPPGFQLQNRPDAVVGQGRDGSQFIFLMAPIQPGQSLEPVVAAGWRQLTGGQVPRADYRETRISQYDAVVSRAALRGNRGPMTVSVNALRFEPDRAVLFLTAAPQGAGDRFRPLLDSFRRLSVPELAAAKRGRRIDVVTVRAGDTVAGLAARMAPPYNREASFLALNGIPNRPLMAGQRLKLIVG